MSAIARVLLPALVLVLLAACGSEQDPPRVGSDPAGDAGAPTGLADRTFVVVSATVAGAERELTAEVRFSFEGDNVSVVTGCNAMSGTWTADGAKVSFGPMMATEMGCEPELMAQEQWVADLLTGPMTVAADSFTFGDTALTVADREDVSPDLTLTGQRWRLDTIVSGESASSVPAGAKAWLEFADDGTVTGLLGCNRGSGSWTEENGVLRVSMASTRMACQGARGEVEAAMNAVLTADITATITERRLDLAAGDAGLGFTGE